VDCGDFGGASPSRPVAGFSAAHAAASNRLITTVDEGKAFHTINQEFPREPVGQRWDEARPILLIVRPMPRLEPERAPTWAQGILLIERKVYPPFSSG
jgi:hypothetical protein